MKVFTCAFCGEPITGRERMMYRALELPDGLVIQAYWHYICFPRDIEYGVILGNFTFEATSEAFSKIAKRGYSRVDVTLKKI